MDASFMGIAGYDHALPPADPDAAGREAAAVAGLLRAPETAGDGMEARLKRNALGHAARLLAERPRYRDPTWYTGEVAFGLISLLLPTAVERPAEALTARSAGADREVDHRAAALAARLAAVPRFLAEGCWQLAGAAAFSGWTARARKEVQVIRRLLDGRLQMHPLWRPSMQSLLPPAVAALGAFDAVVAALPDADPRCGRDHLDFVLREVHGLPFGPEAALARAEDAIARTRTELAAMARGLDPETSWQDQLAALARLCPDPDGVPETYRRFHEQAMESAAALLTPAADYGLAFEPFPEWSLDISADLYFLAYRCPPGMAAGGGSVYWTAPPGQSLATLKSTHAVHHGSIGHHTQNARARVAASPLARIAGQDCARGLAFQAAGTMVEGWACYVQELMAEVPGFYAPAELLLARWNERRNAACLVADIKFHTGVWDIHAMRRQYREEAGFPAARVDSEVVRNTLFPGNRAMYWLGVEQIKAARVRWTGDVRAFHDGLLARGHVPVRWAIDDLFATL